MTTAPRSTAARICQAATATTVNGLQPPANQSPRVQMNARACLNCHVARAWVESSGRREVPALDAPKLGAAMKTKQHRLAVRTCVLAVRAAIVALIAAPVAYAARSGDDESQSVQLRSRRSYVEAALGYVSAGLGQVRRVQRTVPTRARSASSTWTSAAAAAWDSNDATRWRIVGSDLGLETRDMRGRVWAAGHVPDQRRLRRAAAQPLRHVPDPVSWRRQR